MTERILDPIHTAEKNRSNELIMRYIARKAIPEAAPVVRIHIDRSEVEAPCETESELE